MNLVPEKRLDVNGRLVTRHVRPPEPQRNIAFPPLPPMSHFSEEFGTSLRCATSITESIYSFDDNGELVNANGDEVHDYGYEEARDALTDLFPAYMLELLNEKLEGANRRVRNLLAEQVYQHIEDYCFSRNRDDRESEESLPSKLGKLILSSIKDSVELAGLADDFASATADNDRLSASMNNASRSIRRSCDTAEWKKLLTDEDSRRVMLESEFIIDLVTGKRIDSESYRTPSEIYANRVGIMRNYSRVKENQAALSLRGQVDVSIVDELEKNSLPLREGTL